ncbi:TPA: DHH family phosphoesterase [Streptococcus suis]|uniref:Cyclic-di-AMP phosphodiesterase n=1 Tax=Streptococcus suis TaxID=1307 RepID=A0A123TC94_STRSU|nr:MULTISPECIES: DHH family phosphoesterase [Streptococcus]AXI68520.1 DHH family phosphoesterase [Streptococcus suis]MBL6440746.1 DHH family phosphoesterase [Streptococcus suis]MBM0194456.1 DHH family phosphoesterase [Streptococcus suis]MBM7136880.1 DHH family phosphoesterase [Streptococcus suis]MBM7193042.1 DHH family phosphoesterase [Streptococcus suis]
MKRFRFSTIHFVMIGVILFGLVALVHRLFPIGASTVFALLISLLVLIALFIYQKHSYEFSELEQIEYLNNQANSGLMMLLDKMPVGVIKVRPDSNQVEWFNPFAELIFAQENGEFDQKKLREIIDVGLDEERIYANFSGKRYAVNVDFDQGLFYFFDASTEYSATNSLIGSRPVIGIISVDNYDELEDAVTDSQISQVNSFLAQFVSEFCHDYGIYYRRGTMDRFYFFTDYAVLEKLIENKFSVIDKFREEAKKLDLGLTLSMGLAYGNENHHQIGQVALQNLNMAEVRGGDQVVVKENDESKQPLFFGGGSASSVKRTRTRTRAMMTAVSDKLKSVDAVFVVGHRNLDMDALGSAVGMQYFAQNIMNNAYTVYNPDEMAPDIARAIKKLSDENCSNLLTVEEAMKMVTFQSLLIMVDHSKIGLTLDKDFYEQFTQVVVVDHHRRDTDFPNNAVLTYIESGASSASELVTELIQFQNDKHHKLNRIQSSLLMAGIMLDTKNFTSRVTSRTFDVASYLRTRGSDSLEIQQIAATDFEEYRQINELILSGQRIESNVVIACADDTKEYDNIIPSKAANTILDMAGIEAVFVVTRNTKGYVSISARSHSKINVQRIMEEMGGGGHFNLAAAQVYDQTIAEVCEKLTDKIREEINGN